MGWLKVTLSPAAALVPAVTTNRIYTVFAGVVPVTLYTPVETSPVREVDMIVLPSDWTNSTPNLNAPPERLMNVSRCRDGYSHKREEDVCASQIDRVFRAVVAGVMTSC
jgi:hypothetical protein